jgi:hypothetical protein
MITNLAHNHTTEVTTEPEQSPPKLTANPGAATTTSDTELPIDA